MKNFVKNREGGVVQLIILILIVLFIVSYFGINSPAGFWDWIVTTFHKIFP